MLTTDPIADMLTRIRNALIAKHDDVVVPCSNMKLAIAKILLDEGYIKDFKVKEDGVVKNIMITLKYAENHTRVITGLRRISKPGLRLYVRGDQVPRVLNGLGIAVISTSRGVMTDRAARAQGIGGEVLAYIW